MAQSIQEQMDAIKALTNELDQNVRMLKRIVAEDLEQEDKNSENPESLFDQLD